VDNTVRLVVAKPVCSLAVVPLTVLGAADVMKVLEVVAVPMVLVAVAISMSHRVATTVQLNNMKTIEERQA